MDQQNMADMNPGEVETPATVSPTEEQKTETAVPEDSSETAEKLDETPETSEEGTEDLPDALPEDKSEQGRAFAEMRRKIKELEEQVEGKKTRQSSFDTLKNITPPPQFVQVDPDRFYDPQGNFNRPAYDVALQQANIHNQNVQRQIAQEAVDQKLDEFNARQKYPTLNTNKQFERVVAAEYQTRLIETLSDPTKPQPRIEQIAEEYAPYFTTNKKDLVKEATQKVKEQLTVKEQASLSATGRSQPGVQSTEEFERLRTASRKGDSQAIMERFKRIRSK